MKKLLTASEMQAADQAAIKRYAIPGRVLMENAGRGVVEAVLRHVPDLFRKKCVVFAGPGNNGGDGFVIARHLFNHGTDVQVALLGTRGRLKGDAAANAKIAHHMGVPILEMKETNLKTVQHGLRHAHIVFDAIFGTGLTRPAQGLYAKAIQKINASGKYVVAVDLPSGAGTDSGRILGPQVRAHLTCALAQYKRSHLLFPAAEMVGVLELVDIGLPPAVRDSLSDTVALVEEEDVRPLFPWRQRDTHKGTYGHLLVLAGSRGKGGAAGLTALAGLRAGAGLVTLACPQSLIPALEFHPLETMSLGLPETQSGALEAGGLDALLAALPGKTALAVGPGLGTGAATLKLLENLLPQVAIPLVVDADGLNLIAQSKTLLQRLPVQTVLTPHPKEMSRLCGQTPRHILENPVEVVQAFSRRTQTVLILKGARTLVGLPDGRVRINATGNPGMATAGSGDVLTGLLGGLLAQGLPPADAAVAGVYLHGLAGDVYAQANSETTLIAGDLLRTLPDVLRRILP